MENVAPAEGIIRPHDVEGNGISPDRYPSYPENRPNLVIYVRLFEGNEAWKKTLF